jgi:hypothetical protein
MDRQPGRGDVSVTNTNDDTAGITVSPTSMMTTEASGTATLRRSEHPGRRDDRPDVQRHQ